ncbi:hypothetical protein Tco_1275531 [Tanacetum coccineum]
MVSLKDVIVRLIEAARIMLICTKALLFLWAEAVATALRTWEVTTMHDMSECVASEHSGAGPDLHDMTHATNCSGLCPKTLLLQHRNHLPQHCYIQDAPSTQVTLIQHPKLTPVIPNDVEEDNHDIEPIGTKVTHLNIISMNSIDQFSTRLQLPDQALFCYYDAFLTAVEPKTYKDALNQSCWIEEMQEELNEFERLEITLNHVYKLRKLFMGLKQEPARGMTCCLRPDIQRLIRGSVDPTLFILKSKLDEDKEGKAVDLHTIMVDYRIRHLSIRYLDLSVSKRNINRGLWFSAGFFNCTNQHLHMRIMRVVKIHADSTSGSMQFLGDRLLSWSIKGRKALRYPVWKQNILLCRDVVLKFFG